MIGSKQRVYTRLQLSTIMIPPGSDFDLSEDVRLADEAADIMITLNGEPRNVARPVHRKYILNIAARDMHAAGLSDITPGDYAEVIPSEPLAVSVPGGATTVHLPRAAIEVSGLTADGEKVFPIVQPASPLPLQTVRAGARISALRTRPAVTFAAPVVLARFRPVLACVVTAWDFSADERAATVSWSLSLREI